MPHSTLPALLRHEFSGYTPVKFRQDVVAGFAVTAVALPLALAFAVASGANAGAGLVTAIVAGFVIGGLSGAPYQVLSLRGTPLIDTSGLQALAALHARLQRSGGTLMLAGMHVDVRRMLERGGLLAAIGAENIFWSADQAIVAAEQRACADCASSPA